MPSVVSSGSPGRFCPRCAHVTKARPSRCPANRMSRGSSPTRSVRVTRESRHVGGIDLDDADAVRRG
jgi:hypothetical protein